MVKIEEFDTDVADEAAGLAVTAASGEPAFFVTLIAFRRGRIIGSAVATLAKERDISSTVEQIARGARRPDRGSGDRQDR